MAHPSPGVYNDEKPPLCNDYVRSPETNSNRGLQQENDGACLDITCKASETITLPDNNLDGGDSALAIGF